MSRKLPRTLQAAPTVAALEVSRSKLATWASIGFAVAVLAS
jgi:hypothetical protein